jgi:hypothetical protein
VTGHVIRATRRSPNRYVQAALDDHSRLADAEILDDEKGATRAGFLTRAAAFYAGQASPSSGSSTTAKNHPDLPGLRRRRSSGRSPAEVHPLALPPRHPSGTLRL